MSHIKGKSSIKKLKYMMENKVEFDEIYDFLKSSDNKITYEELVTQKILLKLFWNKDFSESQKDIISKLFCSIYKMQSEELRNNWQFVKIFFPLMKSIMNNIQNKIVEYFDNSLSIFIYCLGLFVYENPDIILLPKNLIMNIASQILKDDVTNNLEINSKIIMSDSTYDKRKDIIENIYNEAIEYGVIYEQYDNVSYMRSKIKSVKFENKKPVAEIEMLNSDFEKSITLGSLYDEFIYYYKLGDEPGIIHRYYECKVCKFCKITYQDDEIKNVALKLLNWQFKTIKTIDMFYLMSESIPNYLYSIISLLYTELILLILFSDDNYRLIDKNDIKNSMMFGEYISEKEFEICISLICNKENAIKNFVQESIPFFGMGNKIIVGRWMYNHDLSLIEEVKNISFNSRRHKLLGETSEHFGKKVFEDIIRIRFKEFDWKVVEHPIKLKDDKKQTKTDIDLVAFKDGVVVIGQIKVANCGRNDYQIWKTGKVIEKGIEQAIFSKQAISKDSNLLFSVLKKNGIVCNNNEIKDIIYMVITSSNYFYKYTDISNVSVIGIELLDEWLAYTQNIETDVKLNDFLNSPFNIHDLNKLVYQTESVIDNETFKIVYNEFEVKEHEFKFIT